MRVLLVAALLALTSCASIVSETNYPISLESNVPGSRVEIRDSDGLKIFSGTTPTTAILKSGDGFFSKAAYTATFSSPGMHEESLPIVASLDGWYFGNFLFGGLVGFLFVDPLTGAMFKIDQRYLEANMLRNEGGVAMPVAVGP